MRRVASGRQSSCDAIAIGRPRSNFTSLNSPHCVSSMSALKRITDASQTLRHVRKVPTPDSCTAALLGLFGLGSARFDCADIHDNRGMMVRCMRREWTTTYPDRFSDKARNLTGHRVLALKDVNGKSFTDIVLLIISGEARRSLKR